MRTSCATKLCRGRRVLRRSRRRGRQDTGWRWLLHPTPGGSAIEIAEHRSFLPPPPRPFPPFPPLPPIPFPQLPVLPQPLLLLLLLLSLLLLRPPRENRSHLGSNPYVTSCTSYALVLHLQHVHCSVLFHHPPPAHMCVGTPRHSQTSTDTSSGSGSTNHGSGPGSGSGYHSIYDLMCTCYLFNTAPAIYSILSHRPPATYWIWFWEL